MHAPYTPSSPASTIAPATNIFATTAVITGHTLGHKLSAKTAAQRAAIAASDMDGGLTIKNLTIGQVGILYGISRPTLDKARSLTPEKRALVAKGDRPLVTSQGHAKKILRAYYSDFDIARLIDAIGADRVMAVLTG
jgi:hypothetical protein